MGMQGSNAASDLAELLVQLGRAAYADCAAGDLTPAQWTALRFFSRANRFSRTVSAFADFHATTRGTASQTVRSLVDRELLTRQASERDGRSVLFELSATGRHSLERDPLHALARAGERLGSERELLITEELRRLRDWLAEERKGAALGNCSRCGHLRRDGEKLSCGLLQESLAESELQEYCVRYRPTAEAPPSDGE
jgi:DNA-binding MarR family transcriptional regulator